MKNNETNVILNVHTKAVPGHEEEVFRLLLALVEPTRAEPGCMTYELHRHPTDPGRFMFYERFVDQAAMDAHGLTDHLKNIRAIRAASTPDPIESQVVEKWKAVA
jgi:quinol monooxygenase YgiN